MKCSACGDDTPLSDRPGRYLVSAIAATLGMLFVPTGEVVVSVIWAWLAVVSLVGVWSKMGAAGANVYAQTGRRFGVQCPSCGEEMRVRPWSV